MLTRIAGFFLTMARTHIFGRSGVGKSWFLGWYLERTVPEFDYAVHFDIEDEEVGLSEKGRAIFKTFYVDDQFFEQRVVYREREMPLIHAVILHNKKVRIVPDNLTPEEQRELFAQICELSMKVGKTEANFHISADEAHQVLPDIGDDLDDRIVRMLTGGRKKGVEWMVSTQRPSNLHDEAFSQANYGYYFSLTKDIDVARVNGSSNFNAYQLLPDLDTREFLMEDLDRGKLFRRSTDEMEREHEHFAGDDGVADETIMGSVEDAETLQDPEADVEEAVATDGSG